MLRKISLSPSASSYSSVFAIPGIVSCLRFSASSSSQQPLSKRNHKRKLHRAKFGKTTGFSRRKTLHEVVFDEETSAEFLAAAGGGAASSSSSHGIQRASSGAPNASSSPLSATSSTQRFLRNWSSSGENFCSICNEPYQTETEHRSKREHISIELFFEVIVEFARDWKPRRVIQAFDALGGKKSHNHPAFASFPQLLTLVDERERINRRQEVFSIAKHLAERGAIYLGHRQWAHPLLSEMDMAHQGTLVLYFWQHPEVMRCLPQAECAQVSSFTQQCSCMYNLGTVYDFLGFADLIDARDLPNFTSAAMAAAVAEETQAAMEQQREQQLLQKSGRRLAQVSLGKAHQQMKPYNTASMEMMSVEDLAFSSLPTSSSSSSSAAASGNVDLGLSFGDTVSGINKVPETSELPWYQKGVCLRNLLGQLRWALSEEPQCHRHPIGRHLLLHEPHMRVLAERLVHGIVAEMVFCRFSEYITRADMAWRHLGCPTTPISPSPIVSNTFSASSSTVASLTNNNRKALVSPSALVAQQKANKLKQQQQQSSVRTPSYRLPKGNSKSAAPCFSMPIFESTRNSHFDTHVTNRGAGGARAADRACLMLHGSYQDALAAVLGMNSGSCDFLSGGRPIAEHSRYRFLTPEHTRKWSLGELARIEFEEEEHRQKAEWNAKEAAAAAKKAQEKNVKKNVESSLSSPSLVAAADSSKPEPEVKAKLRPLFRVAGTHMSPTAERLLGEATGGRRRVVQAQ